MARTHSFLPLSEVEVGVEITEEIIGDNKPDAASGPGPSEANRFNWRVWTQNEVVHPATRQPGNWAPPA